MEKLIIQFKLSTLVISKVRSQKMRVYKFYNKKFGLEAIKKQRLKITTLKDLNDPFEFQALYSDDKKNRDALARSVKKTFEKVGIICFSKSWSNPVLWSHYAECHKGLALGFDVPDKNIHKVIYKSNRVKTSILREAPNSILSHEPHQKAMKTKYKHWKYEDEARLFCALNDIDSDTGLYFESFELLGIDLKEVILGALYEPENDSQIKEQLSKEKIKVKTSRLASKSFSIVPQRATKFLKQV